MQALGERCKRVGRGLVDPLEVFDDEDNRTTPAAAQRELPQCFHGAGPDGLGRQTPEPLSSRLDAEQVQEVRCSLLGGEFQRLKAPAKPLGDDLGRVALAYAKVPADDVNNRVVWRRAAVGHAAPLEPCHLTGEALAELLNES